jgi:hypothetical protein
MNRKKALEDFLNDSVEVIQLGLYKWREIHYEVIPRSLALKRHNWSGFVRKEFRGRSYMIREASKETIQKYYATT